MNIDKDIEIVKNIKYITLSGNINGQFVRAEIPEEDKQAISNVLRELETYKKIAEKLASVLGKRGVVTLQPIPPYNDNALLEKVVINGKDEIIDWARKEVEK